MSKRGRKTAGELEAIEGIPTRPEPPEDLNEIEQRIWRQVTTGLPADWFGEENLQDLRAYCRHMFTFEQLSNDVEENWDDLDVMEKHKLLKSRELESRVAITHGTKLRITKQSTVRAEKSKKPGAGSAPWQSVK